MKLLDKTNRYFLGVSLVIFCLGGVLFYFLFQVIVDDDIDYKLQERKDYTIKQLEHSDSLVLYQRFSANMLGIKRISEVSTEAEALTDTLIYDFFEKKSLLYRQLTFQKVIGGKAYEIHVRRASVEQDALVEDIVIMEALLFAAFVLVLSLVNDRVSRNIWEPFYFTLDKINNYKIDLAESMKLPKGTIDEFNELSVAIEKMSVKIHREFMIQKEFSENASHEIQTPLAIVRNKLEILMQSSLSMEQMELINSAMIAVNRLAKLNEALIILSKIDNRQFHDVVEINLATMIDRILDGLDELIKLKSIEVVKDYRDEVTIKMHPYLCEIWLENLIVNSVKHNRPAGKIIITLNVTQLRIANTGEASSVAPDKLFQRFVKSNAKSHSLGLGLSIVKAVCETYGLPITYRVTGDMHTMTVLLSKPAVSE